MTVTFSPEPSRQAGDLDELGGPDEWSFVERAACHGRTDLFFPRASERPGARAEREARARHLCGACPVRSTCRDVGRARAEYGIWGGETEAERMMAGVHLQYPVGAGHVRRHLRAVADTPLEMPLSEMVEPTSEQLDGLEGWLSDEAG